MENYENIHVLVTPLSRVMTSGIKPELNEMFQFQMAYANRVDPDQTAPEGAV